MSRSYVQRHQQPALAAMTPARRRRIFRVAAAAAPIKLPERRRRQARKPRGSNESLRVYLKTPARRPTKRVPPLPAHQRSARGRRRYRTMALADSRQQPIRNPCDGRKPQIPQLLAGTRVEPPVSVPNAKSTRPHATAEADPLDDPPGTRSGACALRGVP